MGKTQGKRPSEDLDISGMVILKWTAEKDDGVLWIGFIWLTIWINGGLL
jgi:hypothetical protein